MKKVGIIGGAGPLASALFYELMIQESCHQGRPVPEILLLNFPFTRGLTVQEGKEHALILQDELRYCVKSLRRHAVDIGVVTCNTLHLYLQKVPTQAIAFLSLPQLVMQEAKSQGHRRLLILGTQNTCQGHLYNDPELTMLYPTATEQQLLDGVIDRVLEGNVCATDSCLVGELITRTAQQKVFDGVVLGCTDLPVLHHRFPIRSAKPLLDSIKIPVKILGGLL